MKACLTFKNGGRQRIVVGVLGFYLLVGMHIYIPNMGGSGLALPGNMLAWLAMAAVVSAVCLGGRLGARPEHWLLTRNSRLFLLGMLLLCLPWFYSPNPWRENASLRVLGMVGGCLFYLVLLQCRLRSQVITTLLWLILGAATLEAGLALLQMYILQPGNWLEFNVGVARPYGIFQQTNVMATFLATGLATALYLLLNGARTEPVRRCLLALLLTLLSALIVVMKSRTGWIGGTLAVLLMLVLQRTQRKTVLMAVTAILCGVLLGFGMLGNPTLTSLDHPGSNYHRWIMVKQTLAMIAQKPVLGWGYGSFDYHFHHFLIQQQPPIRVDEHADHPHNELLFGWMEGGIVALVGMLLLAYGYLSLLARAWQHNRRAMEGHNAFGIGLLTLPLALHTQTEYPFYLAVPTWLVFLLLLALLDSLCGERLPNRRRIGHRGLQAAMVAGSVGVILFMATGIYAGWVLTQAERQTLRVLPSKFSLLNPWSQSTRYEYDRNLYHLLVYNHSKNRELLIRYLDWSQYYLMVHIEVNVYVNAIVISKILNDSLLAEKLTREAALLFHNDPRLIALSEKVER